jgi:hypothetical protein
LFALELGVPSISHPACAVDFIFHAGVIGIGADMARILIARGIGWAGSVSDWMATHPIWTILLLLFFVGAISSSILNQHQTTPIVRNIAAPCEVVRGYVRGMATGDYARSHDFRLGRDAPGQIDILMGSTIRTEYTLLPTASAGCALHLNSYALLKDGKESDLYSPSRERDADYRDVIRSFQELADTVKQQTEDLYRQHSSAGGATR